MYGFTTNHCQHILKTSKVDSEWKFYSEGKKRRFRKRQNSDETRSAKLAPIYASLLVELGIERAIAVHAAPGDLDAEGAVARIVGGRHGVDRRREPAVIHRGAAIAGMRTRALRLPVAPQQLCGLERARVRRAVICVFGPSNGFFHRYCMGKERAFWVGVEVIFLNLKFPRWVLLYENSEKYCSTHFFKIPKDVWQLFLMSQIWLDSNKIILSI